MSILMRKAILAIFIFTLFIQNIYANNLGNYIQSIDYADVYAKQDEYSKI